MHLGTPVEAACGTQGQGPGGEGGRKPGLGPEQPEHGVVAQRFGHRRGAQPVDRDRRGHTRHRLYPQAHRVSEAQVEPREKGIQGFLPERQGSIRPLMNGQRLALVVLQHRGPHPVQDPGGAAGERGGVGDWLEDLGWDVLRLVFTGGVKVGKAKFCTDFDQLLREDRYHVVVDKDWVGPQMWAQLSGGASMTRGVLEGDIDYRKHRHQFTHSVRKYVGNRLVIEAKTEHDHDDHVDSALLMLQAAMLGAPLPTDVWDKHPGKERATSGLVRDAEAGRGRVVDEDGFRRRGGFEEEW